MLITGATYRAVLFLVLRNLGAKRSLMYRGVTHMPSTYYPK